jgi:DNA-binding LacI/PurR family transcriptional regulator
MEVLITRVITTIMLTMSDVAKRSGVSRSTVSLVLNKRHVENVRIPEATRQRILEAALELGYRHNALARSVASGKSRMIGYLVVDPGYEPYWKTIVGALSEAEKQGFTLKVLSVTQETLAERIQQCIELRLSGLIVRMNSEKSLIFEEANSARMPVVAVDDGVPQPFGIRVASDDAVGCRAAISHLVGLGHRKIGFISSGFPQLNQSGPDIGSAREEFYREQMAAHNLDVPEGYVTYESMSVYGDEAENEVGASSALSAVSALLEHPAGSPTAIFCWRDEAALVAIRVCRRQGLRVPEDISVVGFSDISAARLCDPPLSTVKSPWDEMGRTAVRQIMCNRGEEFDPSPQSFLLASGFVARQSSGPAPNLPRASRLNNCAVPT